jgi:Protein ChrB, N-terminal
MNLLGLVRENVGVTNEQASTSTSTDASAAGDAAGPGWLVLIYRVPPEPTRLRSTVWRRIKALGAIYLQSSVAALPASPANERSLRRLRREILDMSGTAILLSAAALAGDAEVRAAFLAARNDEYEEIVDKCEDFLRQVQKEYDENHFTYAELEENEEDLVKLKNWFAKIVDRDVFNADGRPATERALEACEQSLEAYAVRVYAEEAEGQ